MRVAWISRAIKTTEYLLRIVLEVYIFLFQKLCIDTNKTTLEYGRRRKRVCW